MNGEGFIADQNGYYINKKPSSILDYGFDWSQWLDAEAIETSTWSVQSGLEKSNESHDDTTTSVKISGGVAGETYVVTNTIVTDSGLQDSRSFRIVVEA